MLWVGRTRWFTAIDKLVSDKGSLGVWFLSVLKITGGGGNEYTQSELLRWLGESVWFPINLLPSERVQWSAINNNTARLNFTYKTYNIFYIVNFKENGEILQLETKRHMGNNQPETWIGKLSDYHEHHRMLIPTAIEAMWQLNQTHYPYARFKLQQIEYNISGH